MTCFYSNGRCYKWHESTWEVVLFVYHSIQGSPEIRVNRVCHPSHEIVIVPQ